MQNKICFSDIEINHGFWKKKQDMVADTTLYAVYNRFKETHRFDALRCDWKEGEPNMPHIFWDSDVAKWIEGASYILIKNKNKELEKIVDDAIELIVKNSDEHGYFNSHFLVTRQKERFCHRSEHELYCAGHLIEAAVAYYEATGKDKFLKAMCRYADYIEQIFKIEKSTKFVTPGHPELELALVRLYRVTGEARYLKLAEFFINEHGIHEHDMDTFYSAYNRYYNQDEIPVRERETAEGHCVRALYLLCGMADVAAERGDEVLMAACRRVFDNIVNKRMYITGGVGSTHIGETFTIDYDLPNRTAYAETCAAIALAMFAGRMQMVELDSKYADVVERVLYNGFLSGISMDGKAFFYENPLRIDPDFNDINISTYEKERFPITQRKEVFDCSCCPPNIVRFIPSLADFMYTYDEETVYIHQYIDSETAYNGIEILQKTDYPSNGKIIIRYKSDKKFLALRIPGWCKRFTLDKEYEMKNGYAFVKVSETGSVTLNLDMPVVAVQANRRAHENAGRIAVMRGPVVYCAEGVDNGKDLESIRIDIHEEFYLSDAEFLLPAITTKGYQEAVSEQLYYTAGHHYIEIPLTFIPYYAFANRGTTEMIVWFLKK